VGSPITVIAVAMFLVVAGAILSVFSEPKSDPRHTPVEPEQTLKGGL
jgi:hypothetical protein